MELVLQRVSACQTLRSIRGPLNDKSMFNNRKLTEIYTDQIVSPSLTIDVYHLVAELEIFLRRRRGPKHEKNVASYSPNNFRRRTWISNFTELNSNLNIEEQE